MIRRVGPTRDHVAALPSSSASSACSRSGVDGVRRRRRWRHLPDRHPVDSPRDVSGGDVLVRVDVHRDIP